MQPNKRYLDTSTVFGLLQINRKIEKRDEQKAAVN